MKIRRIVVGLDIAPHSRAALAAAAALAGALDAELEALFVESEELHRLAALPFARELGRQTAAVRPIDTAAMQRAVEAQVRESRLALARLAAPLALRWTFRVARGSVATELHAATSATDLAVTGAPRWSPEALQLAGGPSATLIVLPQGPAARGPLAALCPAAVDPQHAVALLAPLAATVGGGLTIVVLARSVAAARPWCRKATSLLDAANLRAQLEIVRDDQPEALQAALERLLPRAVAVVSPPAPSA